MQPATKWTNRVKGREAPQSRQAFHHSHSSIGAAGHWIREAGILAPLVITEMIESPVKQRKYIRMAAILTTLFSEGMYTAKVHHQRQEARERERACLEMA